MRRSRKIMFGLALIGAFYAYDGYQKASARMPVTARVEQVETLCTASVYRSSGYMNQRDRVVPEQECARVRYLVDRLNQFRGYRIYEKTYVHFSYATPQDGSRRTGRQLLERDRHSALPNVGDELAILVSGERAELVNRI